MKISPRIQKLEEVLRSSKLVAGGFMGNDSRSVCEIIDSDTAEVSRLGFTLKKISQRMREISDTATEGLGNWVKINDKCEAMVDEARGPLVCPWPHAGRFTKTVTIVKTVKTGQTIMWSDLSIHLIGEHGFFEGRGSLYRIEPREIVKIIF